MLVLQNVEQKRKIMQGIKWGGLLPISSFGSRHSRWCCNRKGVARMTGVHVSTPMQL